MSSKLNQINSHLQRHFPHLAAENLFERLTMLQQEIRRDLSHREAQEMVIWQIISQYNDHHLDYLWSCYQAGHSTPKAA